ncbi:hypothetical protein POTOM_029837 [Populus tomentosa]|uniref:Uncharacterized protein n=1 Tax=Populus tomentosa TaxID=118781 RepID=A0A8X7ZBQ6_POPTO|nr:hypothetical protein POTOM_029837 [Populus tomentosa]
MLYRVVGNRYIGNAAADMIVNSCAVLDVWILHQSDLDMPAAKETHVLDLLCSLNSFRTLAQRGKAEVSFSSRWDLVISRSMTIATAGPRGNKVSGKLGYLPIFPTIS